MSEHHLNDQELVRREKMRQLREKGIDPFGHSFKKNAFSKDIQKQFELFDKLTLESIDISEKTFIIAGRVMTKRVMGKAGFFHCQDQEGQIQVYVKKDIVLNETFEYFEQLDLGDIIGVEGYVFRTNHGELSIFATVITHLSKALRPLPSKFHGLEDKEERYRRRYVDLIMNQDSFEIARKRPRIIKAMRNYFDSIGCVEVETPVLTPILGGAAARPFVTHHNTLDMDFYLRIATELPLKRLIVGGFEGVYEIGRLFRNEGMSPKHNPEFTTIEAYIAYSDMQGMMIVIENCLEYIAKQVNHSTDTPWNDKVISLQGPFKRLHMVDAIKEAIGIDFYQVSSTQEALDLAKKHGVNVQKHQQSYGHIVNLFFEEFAESSLIQPTFVFGHPIEISPLAKIDDHDSRFTQRFELFIDGREYANAFSELNDPIDQRERFEAQVREREQGNVEASEMDVDFIEALEYGMPPTGGLGIGIDRLVMLLTNQETIREVILFPHMKHRMDISKK